MYKYCKIWYNENAEKTQKVVKKQKKRREKMKRIMILIIAAMFICATYFSAKERVTQEKGGEEPVFDKQAPETFVIPEIIPDPPF